MTMWKVPLADVTLGPEEIEAVNQVLKSGWLSMGPKTQQFEEEFARFLGVKHALAVANGTVALHLACEALGLKEGDEVLCPALTFVASANAILYTGAKPVFVDVNGPHDLNFSAEDAERKITSRTRAIMIVHYGGYPCDLNAIGALARRHNLRIVEDCAHAPGATYGAKKVGTLGDIGCFSFFSNKNLTTGEGGMVVTDEDELATKTKLARSHGMTTLTWDRHRGHSSSYDVVARGYNYRLDEIRAALGSVQLSRLQNHNAKRRQLTRVYWGLLSGLPLQFPFASEFELESSACHLFPIVLPRETDRSQFMAFLTARGIQTSIHYPPVPDFSYYQQLYGQGYDHRLPQTKDVASHLVTLPLFAHLSRIQLESVTGAVKEFFRQ